MSLDACARLVEKGDPDRFLATMSANPEARDRLWPLYAYNLEIARAPWASREPMIAEMRLQWWVDTLDAIAAGKSHHAHEVAGPLSTLIQERGLDAGALRAMAEARFWDVWQEPFADTPALLAYLDATSGNLMMEAARALGQMRGASRRSVIWRSPPASRHGSGRSRCSWRGGGIRFPPTANPWTSPGAAWRLWPVLGARARLSRAPPRPPCLLPGRRVQRSVRRSMPRKRSGRGCLFQLNLPAEAPWFCAA
ncbi:squalene/phytoene synthase family protein [Haematobacter massiliensis]|uniref:squalene/phytoene synthase family protein n=1 Tax=Haematobacter massiliensis TaxID=195105 RepID=UPI0020CFBD5F|nr:squalene/phytoene synthase family protein [Haematobacter massiliensis]